MSFSDCIKSVGDKISNEDVAEITSRAETLVAEGTDTTSAYKRAAREILRNGLKERESSQKEIEGLGGVVPPRSDGAKQLDLAAVEKEEAATKATKKAQKESLRMSTDATAEIVKNISKKNNIDIKIINAAEATKLLGKENERRKGNYRLDKDTGRAEIVLVHDRISSKEEAVKIMLHELQGHYGVIDMVGAENFDKMAGALEEIRRKGDPLFEEIWENVEGRYKGRSYLVKVAEFYAVAAEYNNAGKFDKPIHKEFMAKIGDMVRAGLRTFGLKSDFTMRDVEIVLGRAMENVETGHAKKHSQDKQLDKVARPSAEKMKSVDLQSQSEQESKLTQGQKEAIEVGGFGRKKGGDFLAKVNETKRRAKTKLRQGMVDQYASFKDVLGDDKSWMMAHLTAAHNGAIEASIEGGQPFITEGVIQIDTKKKSLNDILEPLGENLDQWTYWMAGNRADILSGKGKENLFSDKNIEDLKSLSGEKGGKKEQLFESVRKDFEEMNNAMVQIGVETGLINAEEAKVWKEEGFYMPFYRVLDSDTNTKGPRMIGDAGLVRQTAFKQLKGGKQQIDDLLGNAVLNWNHILSASLKNQAASAALDTAEEIGVAHRVTEKTKGKDAVFVRKGGKEAWYEIDGKDESLILESLMALNYDGLNQTSMKVMRSFKRALTIGVTVSPEFKIRNLMRDTIQAIAVADMDKNVYNNLKQGWAATDRKGDAHYQMLASGATFGDSGYIHGADPEAIKHVVKKGIERDTILDTRLNVKKMFDAYQDFGARLENINRSANYVQALDSEKSLMEAAFEARDHLDFARTGTFPAIRFAAQVVPFLNARLQGLDKMSRAAMDENQRGQLLSVIGMYSLASTMMYLSMKDDDDFKQAEDWERDAYHLFKLPGSEVMYRLPKPFEVGVVATMAERLAEQAVNDDVHGKLFAERAWHAISETFNFNPTPAAVKPMLEIGFNKNWFTGRPIEGISMSKLSPTERRRVWTSQAAVLGSKAMDKVVPWDKVVLSPVQIDHLVKGYLGWAGATMLASTDMLLRPVMDAPEAPAHIVTELPIIKAFAKSGVPKNTKFTSQFYENLGKVNTAYADIEFHKTLKEFDKARELKKDKKSLLKRRKVYNKTKRTLSKINKRMLRIRVSKKFSKEDKRIAIDKLQKRKNILTKRMAEKHPID